MTTSMWRNMGQELPEGGIFVVLSQQKILQMKFRDQHTNWKIRGAILHCGFAREG